MAKLATQIDRQLTELRDGKPSFGLPKSRAGARTVSFPRIILAELREHLASHVGKDDDSLVFTSPTGAPMRRGNFYRRFWLKAVEKENLQGYALPRPPPRGQHPHG